MKYKYFNKCKTREDAQVKFRELSKKYHPDANPGVDAGLFQEISAEYTKFLIYFEIKKETDPGPKNKEKPETKKPKRKLSMRKNHKDELISTFSEAGKKLIQTGLEMLSEKYVDVK